MYSEGMTTRQIGAEVSIPPRTVTRYIKNAGVQLRNPGDPIISQLANREWLESEYIGKHKSTTSIAKDIGCSNRIVATWLKRHGIAARTSGSEKGHNRTTDEARQKQSNARRGQFIGPNNPNWRGGIQLKHPERNRYRAKMWVKAVKDRDGWKCVECDATDRLHAHHIKGWTNHAELRFEISNGMTLCHECHVLAHAGLLRNADKPTSASAP